MVLEYPSPDQISGSTQRAIPAVGLMDPESLNRSSNVVEDLRNEIEKDLIRKDTIARKRMLELEVRRELMMEREIAMCGGYRCASFLKNQAEDMLLEEKMGIGMGISAVSRDDTDQMSEVPFRYRVVEPKISTLNKSPEAEILQVQPPGFNGILLAKPDMIFSGAKQKAIALTEEVADKPSFSSAPVKNGTEWSCALCQVYTTNQDGLNDHYQGKKHKRKEAASGEKKDNKSCNIGLSLKKPKFIQLVERSCDDLISGKKSEEGSSGNSKKSLAMVLEYPSPDQISGSTQLTIPAVGLMDPESLNRSSNVVEEMRNKIEKELIRKEIIAEEIAWKRMLELEVRRELMMETKIAMCGGDRFASFSENQAEAMLLEEKMEKGIPAMSIHDKDQMSEVPFPYRAVEPNISTLNKCLKVEILQVQPPGFNGILLAKPDMIFSGEKRKAITLTEEVVDKPSFSSAPVKNVTEWSCAFCQVCTTSQDGLNDHFQGKKHKRKEAAFREQKDDKSCNIGLSPKKSKFIQLVERPCDDEKKSNKGTKDNDSPSLLFDDSANDLRNNTTHEKQNNG